MKIALITDTHWGARNDNIAFSNYFRKFYDNVFFPYIEKHDIKTCIHLGDVVDRRKYINFKTANDLRENFVERLWKMGVDTHFIIGNHDIFYKNTNSIRDELESIAAQFSSIRTKTSDFKEMKNRHEKTANEFKDQANIFKTEREYLKFVNGLNELAQDYNIELRKLVPNLSDTFPALKDFRTFNNYIMERYVINIQLKGRSLDIGKFIEAVEKIRQGVHIHSCDIKKTGAQGNILSATLELYTYWVKQI